MPKYLQFPNPVNETSARVVASGAVLMGVAYIVTGNSLVLAALTYGFVARVLAGPTFSPLGRLAVQVITPRIRAEHRFVPGPPKRFAQGMGAAFTVTASVFALLGFGTASQVAVAMLVFAATLEAAFGYCLGCVIFAQLMRLNLVPESVCVECADITKRVQTAAR